MFKCTPLCNNNRCVDAGDAIPRGKCYLCKVTAGHLRDIACSVECVMYKENQEEAARLRDFKPQKPDGVDYRDTDHPRYDRIEKEKSVWVVSPGWADIVSGKCKCIQCEYARFKHYIKQMITKEKKRLGNS